MFHAPQFVHVVVNTGSHWCSWWMLCVLGCFRNLFKSLLKSECKKQILMPGPSTTQAQSMHSESWDNWYSVNWLEFLIIVICLLLNCSCRMILFVGMAVLTAPFSLGLSNRSFRQNLQHWTFNLRMETYVSRLQTVTQLDMDKLSSQLLCILMWRRVERFSQLIQWVVSPFRRLSNWDQKLESQSLKSMTLGCN